MNRFLEKYVIIILVSILVFLFMKYLSPVISPFLLAFLIAGALDKLAKKIPIKIKKSFLAGILLVFMGGAIIVIAWTIGSWMIQKGSELAGEMPIYKNDLCKLLSDCCKRLENKFGMDAGKMEHFVLEQVNIFAENMEVKVFPAVMDKSMGYMKSLVALISFLIVTVIAVFLILKDYEKLVNTLKKNEEFTAAWEIAGKVLRYIKTYVKAQGIILLVISVICAIVLTLLGMEGSLVYGILTGFMDMLPFIGTGIMLMPLAFVQLIAGKYWKALVLFLLYVACALIREVLEPKLIGNKVGIFPVGILLAVFAGVKLFGLSGIIKGPIGLVIIFETYKYYKDLDKKKENTI